MAREDFINSLRKHIMAGMSPMEALHKVAKDSGQAPLELMSILTFSEAAPYRDDLEQRIQSYENYGISTVEAWAKVARDIGISQEIVEIIITKYPAKESSGRARIKEHRNKIRYLVANFVIFIGLMLLYDSVSVYRSSIAVSNIIELSIGILFIINGAVLLIKSAETYFINK